MWRLRALLFNVAFYGVTTVMGFLCLPILFFPQSWQKHVPLLWVKSTAFSEKYILGLDYRVVGRENLPPPPYLVAMKHQSAWETMKLYALFGDVAIVLKKELMNVPFWGRYARAMDMVPIDRSKGREATAMMVESAKKILITKRPLVIFPQGTRVPVGEKAPYKQGIIRLYEALDIPLIPVAHNAGVFWGRKSFWKHPGTITVEILPAIAPGQDKDKVMRELETAIETASDRLANDGLRQL